MGSLGVVLFSAIANGSTFVRGRRSTFGLWICSTCTSFHWVWMGNIFCKSRNLQTVRERGPWERLADRASTRGSGSCPARAAVLACTAGSSGPGGERLQDWIVITSRKRRTLRTECCDWRTEIELGVKVYRLMLHVSVELMFVVENVGNISVEHRVQNDPAATKGLCGQVCCANVWPLWPTSSRCRPSWGRTASPRSSREDCSASCAPEFRCNWRRAASNMPFQSLKQSNKTACLRYRNIEVSVLFMSLNSVWILPEIFRTICPSFSWSRMLSHLRSLKTFATVPDF